MSARSQEYVHMSPTVSTHALVRALRMLGGATLIAGLTFLGHPTLASANAPFVVNRTNDAVDLKPGDGRCDSVADMTMAGDQCTLRAAIMEANASPDADIITLPAGIYKLTRAGQD